MFSFCKSSSSLLRGGTGVSGSVPAGRKSVSAPNTNMAPRQKATIATKATISRAAICKIRRGKVTIVSGIENVLKLLLFAGCQT